MPDFEVPPIINIANYIIYNVDVLSLYFFILPSVNCFQVHFLLSFFLYINK